jgi:cation transport regulator ChaC
MPKIDRWERLPAAVRQHLIDRMREREININDLNQLRLWIDARSAGRRLVQRLRFIQNPKTFLLRTQAPKGAAL